jgi:hypothetical protein
MKKLMKIRITFLSMLAVSAAFVASAQVVEYDDMYFNSKDRAKMQASAPLTLKNIPKSISKEQEVATAINPTDSYSARNVNPEYISQSTVNPSGSTEPAPYFIPDYTPTAINQNLTTNSSSSSWNNCNCASSFNNPYYGMTPGYGSGFYPSMAMSGMYGYNPYSYGGYNGFNSGWSSMMSIGFGMGMGSYYPYGGSPYMNNYYGMNYYGGYNSYYPSNVVIINNDNYNNRVAYGKRVSRSSDLNNSVTINNRSTAMVTTDTQGRVRGAGGRVSSDGNTSSTSYYQSGWRSNPDTNSEARSSWSNSGRSGGGSNNSGFSNSRSNSSSFFDSGSSSRSSSSWGGGNSNFSSGGASRSSGGGAVSGGGGSSSSSGVRRGRD